MSIFDSIKNALGGSKSQADEDFTMAPSQVLRNAGIDTSRLDLSFGTHSITVGGEIADEAEREKILDVLAGIPGIETIEDAMSIAAPEPEPAPEAEPEAQPVPEASTEASSEPESAESEAAESAGDAGGKTYTVQSGDTLWKIAEEAYGNGSKYMAIFEANKDILENPDRIFPGQELKIPDIED